MKERPLDPRALDVLALCKAHGALDGAQPLAALTRLAQSFCAASDGSTTWHLQGELLPVAGGEPEVWLALQARADVPLECQRCLQPLSEPLRVSRRFRFVQREDEALRLDEESEDDVLVLPARLNALELLEDELILALPIVPRHDECPVPLPHAAGAAGAAGAGSGGQSQAEVEDEPAPHPFAALAALRGRSGQN